MKPYQGVKGINWHKYHSKDGKIRGYCPGNVARFAGYPISELVIQRVKWNGEEFVKGDKEYDGTKS